MYTSKTIRVPRGNSQDIVLSFKGNYLYLETNLSANRAPGDSPVVLKIDDGEDIILRHSKFELTDYEFNKLTIVVGTQMGQEDVEFFYFITGKGDKKEVVEELKQNVEELKSLVSDD